MAGHRTRVRARVRGRVHLVDHGVHRFVTGEAEADADAALSISIVLNQIAESEDAATAAVVVDTAGWVKCRNNRHRRDTVLVA